MIRMLTSKVNLLGSYRTTSCFLNHLLLHHGISGRMRYASRSSLDLPTLILRTRNLASTVVSTLSSNHRRYTVLLEVLLTVSLTTGKLLEWITTSQDVCVVCYSVRRGTTWRRRPSARDTSSMRTALCLRYVLHSVFRFTVDLLWSPGL